MKRGETSKIVAKEGVTQSPHGCLEGTLKEWTPEMSQGKDIPCRGHGYLKERGEGGQFPGF